MKRLLSSFLLAGLLAANAQAQAPAPACPGPDDVRPEQLLGTWKAQMQGEWSESTVTLVRHPEYAGSFRGTLERATGRWLVAGDYTDGVFTMEESADGQHIAAAWLGEMVDGSCGREIERISID